MKLFIFKPSKYWAYCGGMIIVTAPSYTEACERLKAKCSDANFTQTDFATDPHNERPHDCREVDTWVLFSTVEVSGDTNLCEIEYNYA